jgi:tubulin--tyrosine ligase
LALFAPVPYTPPSDADPEADVDLTPHLTNTCLQGDNSEQNIRLLSELVGSQIFSDGEQSSGITPGLLSQEDVNDIIDQVADVLAETFRAALESPVHFQVHTPLLSWV